MRILGIAGSLRVDSHNGALLRAAAEELPAGAELTIWDGMRDVPVYDQDAEGTPPFAVQALRRAIEEADAVLMSTPEYNHSIPGGLKNALDWVSRPRADSPFEGKPAAVVGASTGMFGAVWAQAETRKVLGALGAKVLDAELPVPLAHERFDESGALVDDDVRAGLREIVRDLHAQCAQNAAVAA
jgi:chromate reductase